MWTGVCGTVCFFSVFVVVSCSESIDSSQKSVRITAGEVVYDLVFSPGEIRSLPENERAEVTVNCSTFPGAEGVQTAPGTDRKDVSVTFKVAVEDKDIAVISNNQEFNCTTNNTTVIGVTGIFLGRTSMTLSFRIVGSNENFKYQSQNEGGVAPSDKTRPTQATGYVSTEVNVPSSTGENQQSNDWTNAEFTLNVAVIRKERLIDRIFVGSVVVLVVIACIAMGCKVETDVIMDVLRKPFAPAIGFGCQYILMPLIAFAVIEIIGLEGGLALGFFAAGCSPGGGASNFYAYLVGGDVNLSITMTLISLLAAFAMIPLWMLTLGVYIVKSDHITIRIPYTNIFTSLLGILVPIAIGIAIKKYRPLWGNKLVKLLRPISLFFIIFMFTFGVYTNVYIFKLMEPALILAGCLLPYVGFGVGCLIATIGKQNWTTIKTIAIETGIQNSGVAIFVMKLTLAQPDSDLAIVAPIVVATFTPIPLICVILYLEIRKRWKGFKKVKTDGEGSLHSDEEGGDSEELENNANIIYKGNADQSALQQLVVKNEETEKDGGAPPTHNGDVAHCDMP